MAGRNLMRRLGGPAQIAQLLGGAEREERKWDS